LLIDSVVGPVCVIIPVSVANPVSPAKMPVPPVITKSIVNVAPPRPLAVPCPELVPNKVPLEKVSVIDPSVKTNCGGLLKSTVDWESELNEP
jgi:hypothetical protein